MYRVHAGTHSGQKHIRSPGTGGVDDCEPLVGAGNKSIHSARDVSVLTHGAVTPVLSDFFFKKHHFYFLCMGVFLHLSICFPCFPSSLRG